MPAQQNLNALVDPVRHEIIERYRLGEDDPHLKVLQAAHNSDDEYFNQMVRDEKLVVLYCKQLGINYKNLSDEEFRWLIRILKNQRKWERLSARGKNDKEKPLLHGLLASMWQRFVLWLFS